MRPQQVGALPIAGQQAPTLPTQAGTLPATTGAAQLDISAIMNMMIMLVVVVMMMKMMGKVTEKAG